MKAMVFGGGLLVAAMTVVGSANAGKTLYYNNFEGAPTESVLNGVPAGVAGISAFPFVPGFNLSDCEVSRNASGLTADCVTNKNAPTDPPGNVLALIQSVAFGFPGQYSASDGDDVLQFEHKISFEKDVTSPEVVSLANYFNTDVNDARLGWGFFALTSPESPVTLCLGISADKIYAFVDGQARESFG